MSDDGSNPAGGFSVTTCTMQSAIFDLTTTAGGSASAANLFQGMTLDPSAFGGIGTAVGSANDQLFSSLGSALSSVNQGLSGFNTSLGSVLTGYLDHDSTVGDWFSALTNPTAVAQNLNGSTTPAAATGTASATNAATATSTAASLPALTTLGTHHYGDSGPDITTLQQQLNALGYPVGTADGHWGLRTTAALAQYAHDQGVTLPAAPGQVDPAVVQSIMNSESADGSIHHQGPTPELYGFRQTSHNGYDAILAARDQWGNGSAGERAAVTQAITNEAASVGANQFTDPGVQAVIISSTHMRGPGGTMAMLNAMASGQPTNYADAHLAPTTVSTLQQLTPDQFQQQFHDVRENYDLDHYIDGGRVDHSTKHVIDGATNWGGLQGRYDREEQEFEQMSPQHQR